MASKIGRPLVLTEPRRAIGLLGGAQDGPQMSIPVRGDQMDLIDIAFVRNALGVLFTISLFVGFINTFIVIGKLNLIYMKPSTLGRRAAQSSERFGYLFTKKEFRRYRNIMFLSMGGCVFSFMSLAILAAVAGK
ncbi:hypothetical protein [Afifella sp. YEN Y35]|uniref:hypothetical protein n=1 Tax=Afifella sp. YEN Y35 TaxID=3388337 RepID=UPI0039E018BF